MWEPAITKIPSARNSAATCGAPLGSRCTSCGAVLVPDASFCTSCGVRVPAGAGEPGAIRRAGTATVSSSEGERRRLTVMFCDLADSTAMSLRLDPETFSEIVDTYYGLCGRAIRRCNGFVANYIGDGLLALFGYPEAGERTSEHAVTAALEIQSAIANLNRAGGAHGVMISSRVGLHHGLVVVTEVGTPERRETHVLGDAVNLAARVPDFRGRRLGRRHRGTDDEDRGLVRVACARRPAAQGRDGADAPLSSGRPGRSRGGTGWAGRAVHLSTA